MSSDSSRRVRVLRPVSRPSPVPSPAGSGGAAGALRTNRPLHHVASTPVLGSAGATPSSSNTSGNPSGGSMTNVVNRALPVMSQAGFAMRAQVMLRRLRETMMALSEARTKGDEIVMAVRKADELYGDLEKLVKLVNLKSVGNPTTTSYYSTASHAPDSLNTLNVLSEAISHDDLAMATASAAVDIASKLEYLNVLKQVPSCLRHHDVSQHRVKESHEQFLTIMRSLLTKERELRGVRQRLFLHPAGFLSHIVEAEFGRRSDPAFVAQVKATILVQYGQLSLIRIGAVGETLWTEQGELNESAYEVYQLMGRFVTAKLHNSSSSTRLASMHTVTTLLTFVQNFASAFSSPCCSCKKLMRDFLPPTRMVDFNAQRPVFQHEACQYLEGDKNNSASASSSSSSTMRR